MNIANQYLGFGREVAIEGLSDEVVVEILINLKNDEKINSEIFINLEDDLLVFVADQLYNFLNEENQFISKEEQQSLKSLSNEDSPTLQTIRPNHFIGSRMPTKLHRVERFESPMKNDQWTSVIEETPQWSSQRLEDVDPEFRYLFKESIIELGYHIEYGDLNAPEHPDLNIVFPNKNSPYYSTSLRLEEHTNYIGIPEAGIDSHPGPVIISKQSKKKKDSDYLKCIVRTQDDFFRLWIPTDYSNFKKKIKTIFEEFENVKFLVMKRKGFSDDLYDLEKTDMRPYVYYKFGVLYVKPGMNETDIYAAVEESQDFREFLDFIGQRVQLKGFSNYNGLLDTERDANGPHSYFTNYKGYEIMFHVVTMLPHREGPDQTLVERKKFIGNDVITIVFKEGDDPFDPTLITSNFNHVYVVVQKIQDPNLKETHYKIAISTKPGVRSSTPALPNPPIFQKGEPFREFLLTKCINLERVSLNMGIFKKVLSRTRRDFLKILVKKYHKINEKNN